MAGLLQATAETVKSRRIQIEAWDQDPKNGKRIAFRATIEGHRFWIAARKPIPKDMDLGVMGRLVRKAQGQDALLLIRIGGRPLRAGLVFDPDAFMEYGHLETRSTSRKRKGERWLNLGTEWACTLADFVEGRAEPLVHDAKERQRQVGDF